MLYLKLVCLGWPVTLCHPMICHSQLTSLFDCISGIWYPRTWKPEPCCDGLPVLDAGDTQNTCHLPLGGGSWKKKNNSLWKAKKKRLRNPHNPHKPKRYRASENLSVKNRNDMAIHLAGAIADALCGQSWSIGSLCIHNPQCHPDHSGQEWSPWPRCSVPLPWALSLQRTSELLEFLPRGAGLRGLIAC